MGPKHLMEWNARDCGEGQSGNCGEPNLAAMADSANAHISAQVAGLIPSLKPAGPIEHTNVTGVARDAPRYARAAAPQHHFRSRLERSYRTTGKSVSILLVDDDKVDAMAVKRSFREL